MLSHADLVAFDSLETLWSSLFHKKVWKYGCLDVWMSGCMDVNVYNLNQVDFFEL